MNRTRKARRSVEKKTLKNIKKLGEGFHGIGYTVKNFYKLLKTIDITNVDLFTTEEDSVKLSDKKDIEAFVTFMSTLEDVIVKVFKNQVLLTMSTIDANIKEEIDINRDIIKLFKQRASDHLTVAPITGFRGLKLLGCVITESDGTMIYATMGHLCNTKFNVTSPEFMLDILNTISILQKQNMQHNDIKPDNLVLCDDRYKLIDWGQAGPLDKIYIGDFIYSNPIKWYIRGYTGFISRKLMDIRARFVDRAYEKSSMYQEQYKRITEEFKTVIDKNSDRKSLMKIYKKSFDIFMLGMTFLYKVYQFKLDYEKYKPLIEAMSSVVDPISDPAVAAKLVKKYI